MKREYRLQMQFDKVLLAWLRDIAVRKHTSMAHVIRELVLEAMNHDTEFRSKRGTKKRA